MAITVDAVRTTLVGIGEALSQGRPRDVANSWEVPGVVLANEGARVVTSRGEIESFFRSAIDAYRAKGTPTAEPELLGVDVLSDRLAAVDVVWRGLDEHGAEQSRETSHYIMRSGDDGIPRIQVALSRESVPK
jgi:hypothetical protein